MSTKLKVLLLTLGVVLVSGCFIAVLLENSIYNENIMIKELARQEAEKQALEKLKEEESKTELKEDYEKQINDYEIINEYYNKLALVMKDNKWGYIDQYGEEVIPLQYDVANNFTNSFAKVKKDGKWGYINTDGEIIIPIEYYYCSEPYNGFVAVGNGGQYGFVSIKGEKICDLMYDKVEPFNEKGIAKVVLDKKYGYIDENGNIVVDILTPYVEENKDFTGEWKETNTHSSKAGIITITGQLSTSFDFRIDAKYFSKLGTIEGTADIIKANVAEYKYGSGEEADIITFSIIDDMLEVTAKNGGNLGMDKELTVSGTYTIDVPKYINDNALEKLFEGNQKLLDRIKNALGEEFYEDYFLYGFKFGEYKVKELDEETDIIKGTLYTVTVPTMEKDFKLLINNKNVYFFIKHSATYKTDDNDRRARVPTAISFDEL